MPVGAIKKATAGQNGVGAFILQCKRIDLHYCTRDGFSRGMNAFLRTKLPDFIRANPGIEFTVSPRPNRAPVLRGHYMNGREKAICVGNKQPDEILKKAELLRDASGEKLKRVTKPVKSLNESVRGIWDQFHSQPGDKWKI